MSELNVNDELMLLERVFYRIGSADTDEQLSACINNFLVPVLQKLSSSHESVKNKVVELLTHITRVVKRSSNIALPVDQLVTLLASSTNNFVLNFTVVFVKISFGRIEGNKQIELIPSLINSIAKRSISHQESILLLIIGCLNKSNVQTASKGVSVIKNHQELISIITELMLDVLLLTYKWAGTDNDPLAGFNNKSMKRLRLNIPLIFTDADYHEQVKLGILGLISANIFESQKILVHSIVGAADTRYTVANSGENELRKITCEIDWSKPSSMIPLYTLFLGVSPNKQDSSKKEPACVRIKLKILPCLCLSKSEESVLWPQCMQIIFDCWNGKNTNQRLKYLALQYAQVIIRQKPEKTLCQATPILLKSGLLKLLDSPELDLNGKQMTYTLIGMLISKVPTSVNNNIGQLQLFFEALIKDTSSDLKGSIRSCLISMCSAYKDSNVLSNILDMLAYYCKISDGLLKQVTTYYLSNLFPANDARSRLLLIQSHATSTGDSDLKKVLYNVDEAGNLIGVNGDALLLPKFSDMVLTVVNSNEKFDIQVLTEIAEYLSHCLTFSAGLPVTYNTLYHPSAHTPEISNYLLTVYKSEAQIIDSFFKLMLQIIQVKPSIIPLNNLLACIAALPNQLASQCIKDLNIIQKLFVSSNEDIRQLSGTMYGIILSNLDDTISNKRTNELVMGIMDKNRSKALETHASLFAVSSLQEFRIYNNKNIPPIINQDIFVTIISILDDASPLLVGTACDVIGAISRLGPMPLDESKKTSLIKTLLKLSFNPSVLSKIRNKAIKCTGFICVGENSENSKIVVQEYLENTKHTKDIEIHLSIGDSISCAILGPYSKMSRNFWMCTEQEYQNNLPINSAVEKCDKLADYFSNSILEKAESEDHPNSRQACCVWIYSVLNECHELPSIKKKLARIQTAFVSLLAEKNSYIQDLASKALIHVYEYETEDHKDQILKLLINQLSEYMSVGKSGKDTSGGILSTYKELCSLVTDLSRPKLLYKFIQLANYNKKKESKSKLEIDEQLCEQLPFIIPRLYRYQYDPTPIVQSSMSAIWSYLVLDTRIIVEKYYKEIYLDLVKNLTCPNWKVRISVCQAFPSFLQYTGDKIFSNCLELTIEAWTELIRVMDDIHEGTRKAATSTAKTLSKLCVNECTNNNQLLQRLLPIILDKGLYHTEASIRAVSMDMISQLIVNCGDKLKSDLAKLIIALLRGADKVETATISMLSVMSGANPDTQEIIDSARAASARSLSSSDVLSKSLLYVDDIVLQELIPLLQELLTANIGLPTKVAASHFVSLLIAQNQHQLSQKFLDRILKSLMKGITDRNPTIRKSYASTIAVITTVAKENTVNKLIQSLKDVYMSNEDDSIRYAVGCALKGISQCEKSDIYLPHIIPLIFFAIHSKQTNDGTNSSKNNEIWKELWEDNVHNTESVLFRQLDSLYEFLGEAIKSSSWAMKSQAARSIGDAAEKLGQSLNEEHRNKFIETIKTGLNGRTWDGKEFLLEALLQLNLSSSNSTENRKNEEIVDLVFNECKKEKINYRMVALNTIGELLEKLKIDRFAQTYQLVMHVIQNSTDNSDIEDKTQNLKLKESLFSLVGKAWPHTLATQVQFGETVVAQCADHLKNNTRPLQIAIIGTLLKVIEKLAFFQLYTNHKQQLKYIFSHVRRALHYSFGVPKSIILRKLSLEIYIMVITNLKSLKAAEELDLFVELYNEFSMNFIADESPEIKLLLQTVKESMG
ncbi:proteasome adapter and scaffold protein ECM29 isoform X2 [Daktulosphaira vitifoliae]|uniref:proteasome adapter and scaffold protein ECM29 isoform X2 n=1 Tax=Daktulosphaira vitifoliae TaxID=58002 RepID=UPI0021AA3E49|nr:proteasome adapter and scaffold protein ECM29 isoform X2 [Daktulosphaira vitifoliae]